MLLPQSFYDRPVLTVTRELVGAVIQSEDVALRITEVEAYHQCDSAAHCYKGKTKRNAPLFGPPGHAYIYLCYGVHNLVNISAEHEGVGAGILIRSADIVRGEDIVLARRKKKRIDRDLLAGPGKVGQALAVSRTWNHVPYYLRGPLEIHAGNATPDLLVGPRVGIGYATPEDQALPWRFADANATAISARTALQPWTPFCT